MPSLNAFDTMSIKKSLFILWKAVEDGVYDARSIAGDQALNMRDTIYKDPKQFWEEYHAHNRSQARSECGQEY